MLSEAGLREQLRRQEFKPVASEANDSDAASKGRAGILYGSGQILFEGSGNLLVLGV
jgi:hypothetical protein